MKKLYLFLVLLAFMVGVLFVLSIDRRFDAFGGDDSTLTYCQKVAFASSSLKQCMVEATGSKWRPLTSLVNYGSYLAYGTHVKAYVLQNILLHSLTAGLIGLCIYFVQSVRMVRERSWLFPCIGTLLYAGMGFSYYNFTQRFGLMEELCVLFVVGMLFITCLQGHTLLRVACVWGLYVLSMLTHERFIALAPFVSLFPLLCLYLPLRRRILLSLVPWVLAGLYLYIKGAVIGARLLVGTAATDVDLSARPLLNRCCSVILNILGFNNGPPHLSAYESSAPVFWAALALLVVLVSVTLSCARRLHRERFGRSVLLFGAGLLPLVLSASVCFRIEFRWMLAPWAVFLLWLVVLCLYLEELGAKTRLRLVLASVSAWVCLSLCQSLLIRANVEQVFFMWWIRDAESMKNCTERNYSDAARPLDVHFESPCPMELERDFVIPANFRSVSAEDLAKMPEAQRNQVPRLRHYSYGWGFTKAKEP